MWGLTVTRTRGGCRWTYEHGVASVWVVQAHGALYVREEDASVDVRSDDVASGLGPGALIVTTQETGHETQTTV